jgi:hypothetical protein
MQPRPSGTSCSARRSLLATLAERYGVKVAATPVCRDHCAPLDFLEAWVYDRPPMSLIHGPRGGGKSYLAAFSTHLDSIKYDGHDTVVLGGSESQSRQIYQALRDFRSCESLGGYDPFVSLGARMATYETGSSVVYIPASQKSVRGPHGPSLRLDEVDEIDNDVREGAMGMPMTLDGVPASVTMCSTWHRQSGPMAALTEQGHAGAFPVWTFCIFDVLERCPESRSGPRLEHCPNCALMRWCHADRDSHPSGLPKAKRSTGHYLINDLISKTPAVSLAVFESDYLCLRPKASSVWFTMFDEAIHVTEAAEYDPSLPVHVAVDPGVHTGCVWLQARRTPDGRPDRVNVFSDYYSYDVGAEANARAIRARTEARCGIASCRVSMDSSGKARTSVGPIVVAEYERVGCRGRNGLEMWPRTLKTDELQLVEALLRSADGVVRLTVHPRCRHLVRALRTYERARRGTELLDSPKDPQHETGEDLIDPLAGALKLEFPAGRAPEPQLRRIPATMLLG